MKQESQSYKLVNLKDRDDIIQRITQAEQELNGMLNGRVALIAYIKEDE
ncbi:hypothetical protein C8P63_101255 [Melghirimyces profundicolus]|uniref:Uncharacterized protein n=1 Tax=Melghirimyces profundicolus TaxID=1242148 RepID=A0A2T6C9N8_9BACL|nr:hypothetical protein [Melghirimyces profundicolus]PTX65031.1 hypothetical protein C8P63_101255 [Melghirimyces profundicolus]